MNSVVFALGLLLAGYAQAAGPNWSDLEVGTAYYTSTDIPLSNEVTIPAERTLILLSVESLSIPVVLMIFKDTACTDLELKTDMELFNPNPDDKTDDNSVGIEYQANCEIGVYIETKDYNDLSIFR